MRRWVRWLWVAIAVAALPARAQQADEVVWVQVEAQPSLRDALQRAEVFARTFDDVNGFALGGGWYAIALGPYRAVDAADILAVYRAEGTIPRDSYIARSTNYGTRFFPPAQDLLRRTAPATQADPLAPAVAAPQTLPPQTSPQVAEPQEPEPQVAEPSDRLAQLERAAQGDLETVAQARRSESALGAEERRALQEALQWAGFYSASIDGAIGRGTRTAMAAWQRSNGLPDTGVLTTAQRALLFGQYNEVLEGLGMASYRDDSIGLALQLPLGVVAFDRYDPPFAHFSATTGLNAQVLLISQPGDQATLASLYDVMQTLEIVPLDGLRRLDRTAFSLVGRSDSIVSETRVQLQDGALKGFTLVWPTGDETRRTRLVEEMSRSLQRLDGVMNPALGDGALQQLDFIAGLAVRKPSVVRSGFFIDARGAVVTTTEAVASCRRILLDETYEAQVSLSDPESGLAILTPVERLSPPQFAQFSRSQPRLQSGVAVAGYSFEGILGSPSVTFGTLAEMQGLRGETDLARLQLSSLPGDAGGPVFDSGGGVLGMLLPRAEADRRLPDDVSFALAGDAIARAMTQAGVQMNTLEEGATLAPEDITARGIDMTVLVACWD